MTGFFFGGGSQSVLVNLMFQTTGKSRADTPVLEVIRELFESGAAPVSGTSAGCVALSSSVMVTGGVSYVALRDGAGIDATNPDDLSYDPWGGLGFFPKGFVLDSHVGQRGREGRLIRLLADTKDIYLGASYGIGIDENTALHVTLYEDGLVNGAVLGTGGVFLTRVDEANFNFNNGLWDASNVRATYLRTVSKLSCS